jgi:hypothetical protein
MSLIRCSRASIALSCSPNFLLNSSTSLFNGDGVGDGRGRGFKVRVVAGDIVSDGGVVVGCEVTGGGGDDLRRRLRLAFECLAVIVGGPGFIVDPEGVIISRGFRDDLVTWLRGREVVVEVAEGLPSTLVSKRGGGDTVDPTTRLRNRKGAGRVAVGRPLSLGSK